MRIRQVLGLIALVAAAGCAPSDGPAEASPEAAGPVAMELSGQLQPGPHAVGFSKTLLVRSGTRSGSPTELDVYRWYPAVDPGGDVEVLTYRDYYRIQEGVARDDASRRDRLLDDMTTPAGLTAAILDEILMSPMWARAEAEPAAGPFPLVLWSYRDSIPTMQTLLAEYLASHGYVVVFAWPRDNVPPFPWNEDVTDEQKLEALEIQVDLLETVLDTMGADPRVDSSRTATLSWSYGGESAQLLQRRRSEVRAAIGIDSTLASGWVYQPIASLDLVPRDELSVPYVLLRHGRPRLGAEETPPPGLLAEIPGGSSYVRLPSLSHGNFNFPGGMIPGLLLLDEVSVWAVGGEDARLGYEVVCRLTAHFLASTLGEDALPPPSWLDSLPDGFVEISRHPAGRR